MKKFALVSIALIALFACKSGEEVGIIQPNACFVEQLQPRDSILIADQLRYGVALNGVGEGTGISLPEVEGQFGPYLEVVEGWTLDTVAFNKKEALYDLKASFTLTSFDEGEYLLPDIPVALNHADGSDTLVFRGADVLFCAVPVDTARFDNGLLYSSGEQMTYPLSWTEVLKWTLPFVLLAAIATAVVLFIRKRKARKAASAQVDPPHIVALRKLDAYRDSSMWEASKQKQFYSGVTDVLREYLSGRYGIGAMEMTTAEIMTALEGEDIPKELRNLLNELFVRSDYVKFAKHIASDEENVTVVPSSVRFVTETYRQEIEKDNVL